MAEAQAEAPETASEPPPPEPAAAPPYVPPSLEIAQAEALKARAVVKNEDGTVTEVPLTASIEEIGVVLGTGLSLYLKALRSLAYLFSGLVCTVYTINVLITLAAAGDQRGAILHGVQTLAKLSLYPMQVLYDPATDAMSSSYGNGTPKSFHPADKKDLLIVISVMDVVAMLCLLAGIAAFRRAAAKSSAEVEAATLTLDDYSAVVYGLPREALDGAEVTAHLEAAVPALKDTVAQVFVGKNFGEFLERLTARGNALEALDSLDAQAAATKKDLSKPRAKLSAKLAKLEGEMANLHEGKLVAVCAYVTFKTHAARDAALDAFPCGALRAALPGLLPRERRFRGTHSLRLRAAPDASSIIWENVQYDAAARQARQSVSGFVTFALLLITVGFITGAKDYESQMPAAVSCTAIAADNLLECDSLWNLTATTSNSDLARVTVNALQAKQSIRTCDGYVSSSGMWTEDWTLWANTSTTPVSVLSTYSTSAVLECAAQVCQGCYCEAQTFFPWLNNEKGLHSFCNAFWGNYVYNWFLKGLSIVSVIVINAVFSALIPVLSRFEKLHTRGELDTSIAVKTFMAAFFNAFVVTLLVYASIRDLSTFPLVFKGDYDDFTPAWFSSIGSSLFITAFTQAVQPPVVSAIMGAIGRFMIPRQIKSRYTQRDLNALLAGPQWLLSTRVAQLLTAMGLIITLCGFYPGVAFLLPICAGLSYRADKYLLLRVARQPPRYDGAMVDRMCGVLIWCVWLHFGLTAWAFGNASLPARHLHLTDQSLDKSVARSDNGQFDVGNRLEKWQCLVQGIPFLIMTLWLFVLRPYVDVLIKLIRSCMPKSAVSAHDVSDDISFPDALAAGKIVGLTSYDPRQNPAYEPALRALTSKPKDETPEEAAEEAAVEAAL